MLISHQVKNAVDHQKGDHPFVVQAESIGLAFGCVYGYDQISQKLRVKTRERAFLHGEGEDVGGLIPVQVSPIQLLDLSISNKNDTQFRLRNFQFGQYLSSQPSYSS